MADKRDASRQDLADIYGEVLSNEVNKSVGAKTLDHFILERKAQLKDARELRDVDGASAGTRPSRLERLQHLQEVLNNTVDTIIEYLRDADKDNKV